jgi:hypothetical protein
MNNQRQFAPRNKLFHGICFPESGGDGGADASMLDLQNRALSLANLPVS